MSTTSTLLLFTLLVAYIVRYTNSGCDYFNEGPIEITKGKVVATDAITIEEQMELWFEIQIEKGWQCATGWCMLIHIGESYTGKPRFPVINLTPGNILQVSFTDHGGWAKIAWTYNSFYQFTINDPYLTTTINDGNIHKIYTKSSPKEKIFIYDDVVLFNHPTPGGFYGFDYSSYYHQQYDVVVVRQTGSPLIPGNITNLCLNSTFLPTMDPTTDPTMEPTVEPTTYAPTSDTLLPTVHPTIYPTMEPTMNPTINPSMEPTTIYPTEYPTKPTINPTLNPTDYDVNVNQEPTMEPTIEPTPKTIIKYVEAEPAKMTAMERDFLIIGISLLCIAILFGGIYCYRNQQKKEKDFKNTIETLTSQQSAENTKDVEMEPPIAFSIPYSKREEEVEGENASKGGNIDNNGNNDTKTDDNDLYIFGQETKLEALYSSSDEINPTTLTNDNGEC